MIVDCAHYLDGVRQPGASTPEAARRAAAEEGGFAWVALSDPSPGEIEQFRTCFALPALAVEESREAHQRPKLHLYANASFLQVKTAQYDEDRREVDFGELDVFLGPSYAVVAGRQASKALTDTRARMDERPRIMAAATTGVAWAALDAVVDAYEPVVDRLDEDLEETERAVFEQGFDQGQRIFLQRRETCRLVRALHPLLSIPEKMERGDPPTTAAAADLRSLLQDVEDHVRRLHEEVITLGGALDALLSSNLTGVTVRQNVVIQKVSSWAAIALVPTLVSGIYGMNFEAMPELDWAFGYPFALGLMVTAVLGLRAQFKRVGWL